MSLRRRRWLARGLITIVGGGLAFVYIRSSLPAGSGLLAVFARARDELVILIPCAAGAVVCGVGLDRWLVRRARRRLTDAFERHAIGEARRRYEDMADSLGRGWSETADGRIALAGILLDEGNYPAVCDVLESVRMETIREDDRCMLLSNFAYAKLKVGDPARAITLAKQALECAPPAVDREIILANLADGYIAAGRHEEAISLLEDALTRGGTPANQARSTLLMGDALVALGRLDEAKTSYSRACELAPSGRSAEAAKERLAQMTPFRS